MVQNNLQFLTSYKNIKTGKTSLEDFCKSNTDVLCKIRYLGNLFAGLLFKCSHFNALQGAFPCRDAPVILGHEFSGVVAAVGSEVTHLKLGDHIAVDPNRWENTFMWKTGGYKNNTKYSVYTLIKYKFSSDTFEMIFCLSTVLPPFFSHLTHLTKITFLLVLPYVYHAHTIQLVSHIQTSFTLPYCLHAILNIVSHALQHPHRGISPHQPHVNLLKPSGYFTYHKV